MNFSNIKYRIVIAILIIICITTIVLYSGIGYSSFRLKEDLDTSIIEKELPKNFQEKNIINVNPCDISGNRRSNVVVDIGFGERKYYATTNNYGQLVEVYAKDLILQKSNEENNNGRYCYDEAKVKGVEKSYLDEGHGIADSLGGVSNAYNITPQNSYLNREGQQSQMEKEIRNDLYNGDSVTDFDYIIKYPNIRTTIPEKYYVQFKVNRVEKKYSFENK